MASRFLSGASPSALQVSTVPAGAGVFLDGKSLGKTPFFDDKLKSGEYFLRLSTDSTSLSTKIKLNSGVLTAVNFDLSSGEASASGEVLTMEKVSVKNKTVGELSVVSSPGKAMISLDAEEKGESPLVLTGLPEGDHEITISLEGYQEKNLKIRINAGYRLNISARLARVENEESEIPVKESGTPVKPTAKPAGKITVLILETPTGWLRVRKDPSLTGEELARVNPGESFPFIEEKPKWFKIEYEKGKEGWVSATYGEKKE